MSRRTMWLMVPLVLGTGVGTVVPGSRAEESARAGKPTVEDVADLWLPRLKSASDYQHFGGSPEQSADVAAYSFRVVGPTFEEMWNHYARLCGMKDRYAEKMFRVAGQSSPNGVAMVSDRASGDGKGGRGPSVFLLRAETYTVTVTFAPDPGGASISGSLSAVLR
jgi:hypothetical protein